ncbi:tyrosine-type recombinase/integrase [Nocardia carnea]|uniref:Tyrosine-type recombinase/integrase n=1 Tax=Nocardia carnea TaxID=37328 RepID=A0ABW7TKJ0_9NOCA|nr:tyrosine-type recombinase/integrase [Nocardia carnea]
MRKLGYEHLRRHDLRHTGLTWFADAVVPWHRLQRIAGHIDPRITQRYLPPDIAAEGRQSTVAARAGPAQIGPNSASGPIRKNPLRRTSEGIFCVGLTGFEPATT